MSDAAASPSPLFPMALAAGSGLLAAYHLPSPWLPALIGAGILLIAACRARRRAPFLLTAVSFLAFFCHGQIDYHLPARGALSGKGDFHQRTLLARLQVIEEPRLNDLEAGRIRFPATLLAVQAGGTWEPARATLQCWAECGEGESVAYGDVIEAPVFLRRPEPAANPGAFDARDYAWVRHVDYEASIPEGEWTRIDSNRGRAPVRWAISLRQHMRERLQAGLEEQPEMASLLAAMLFGERDGLSEERIRVFEVTGTLHLFAVSGQNIHLIAIVLMVALYALGLIRWRWGWLMIAPLFIFVISTGMESSAVRAFLMAALVWVAYLFHRPASPLNALSAAALILWVADPRQIFDLGFQFSFLIVLGLVLVAPFVHRFLYRWGAPDDYLPRKYLPRWRIKVDRGWSWFCGLLATTVVAWVCSLPITVFKFHLFSPVSVPANLVVVTLASGVLLCSLASVLLGSVVAGLSAPINQVSTLLLQAIVGTTQTLAAVPNAYHYVSIHPPPASGEMRILIPSTRHRLTAWIERPGETALIGPGHAWDWKRATFPAARHLGLDRVDRLILSGANTDAIGALEPLRGDLDLGEVVAGDWTSRSPAWRSWQSLADHTRRHRLAERLHPQGNGGLSAAGYEDQALAVHLEGGGGSLLYLGNPGRETYAAIAADVAAADVLLLDPGERGLAPDPGFLTRMRPKLIVIQPPGYASRSILTPGLWDEARQVRAPVIQLEWDGAAMLEFRDGHIRHQTHLPEGDFSTSAWKMIRREQDAAIE